tara:strand:- start:931 stop:1179 length:249 start_codon:yes stop_codon:yes gene_type:complete
MRDSLFTVIGTGAFPLDMLQKARCYPAEEEDVNTLFNYKDKRTINFRGPIPNETIWRARGWTVISRERVYQDDYNQYHTWPC